jgi:succinate dehydrogenase/fumarate reductase cytochrome b subunit
MDDTYIIADVIFGLTVFIGIPLLLIMFHKKVAEFLFDYFFMFHYSFRKENAHVEKHSEEYYQLIKQLQKLVIITLSLWVIAVIVVYHLNSP